MNCSAQIYLQENTSWGLEAFPDASIACPVRAPPLGPSEEGSFLPTDTCFRSASSRGVHKSQHMQAHVVSSTITGILKEIEPHRTKGVMEEKNQSFPGFSYYIQYNSKRSK